VFDGEKEESLNKKAYFVSNYFEYNIRSKQILTRVFRLLEDNINLNHELKSQFLNKTNEMIMILDEALKDINIDFIWEEEISIFEFFKALGLKVNISDTDSIYQKLLSFLDVVSELQLYKLIIFPNIKLFFSEKQLEEIFKYALYRRIKVLCLDSAEHKKLYSNEIKIIVDEFYDIDIKEGEKLDP
jgi:CRISPR type II-A-associated protein Csn2